MKIILTLFAALFIFPTLTLSAPLTVGDSAPTFAAKTHEGKSFSLSERRGTWTVLYFYPKADTPGCTAQACAFRDSIKTIEKEGAQIFGVSADTVEAQAAFHKKHALKFTLLADADLKIINLYGAKMPLMPMSNRWTYIIDPELKIRNVEKDVDPAKDADRVAELIRTMKPKK